MLLLHLLRLQRQLVELRRGEHRMDRLDLLHDHLRDVLHLVQVRLRGRVELRFELFLGELAVRQQSDEVVVLLAPRLSALLKRRDDRVL